MGVVKNAYGAMEWRRGFWHVRIFLGNQILDWRLSGLGRFRRQSPGFSSREEQHDNCDSTIVYLGI